MAVLVLMQPLHFEACRVQPMTLPPPNFVPKHRSTCSVYGWGTIQNPQKKELKSELSVSQVQIRWVDDCWPFFPTKLNAKNHRSTICSAKKGHKLFVVIAYYHCCKLCFPLNFNFHREISVVPWYVKLVLKLMYWSEYQHQ